MNRNNPLRPYFEEGYDAYRDERRLQNNPYPDGDPRAKAWEDGWLTADFDNPRLEE